MQRLIARRAAMLVLMAVPLFASDSQINTYLALGDSIAFGYDPTLVVPNQPLPTPDKFTGYPEVVAAIEKVQKEINAACPGQSSASFLNEKEIDIGCEGFKYSIGLHTQYDGSQNAFAISQLRTNSNIELVTLSIGGNDLALLQVRCAATSTKPKQFNTCVAVGLPGVLTVYAGNLTQILFNIRANYSGRLIIVNNYVPNADPTFVTAITALNSVAAAVSTPFGAKVADAFTAFQLASILYKGDP
ncbi:MAG: SGNH/GDSL hydrolase family protein, partial [Bryobacteraceae bacterium]